MSRRPRPMNRRRRLGGDPPDLLTDDQVAAFERDGFVACSTIADAGRGCLVVRGVRRNVCPHRRVRATTTASTRPRRRSPVLPQIVNPERYAPRSSRARAYANARTSPSQLLGGGDAAMGTTRSTSRRDGAPTPWHQDEAYWDPRFDHEGISIWIPLQDVADDNGCMVFVPGSHRRGRSRTG